MIYAFGLDCGISTGWAAIGVPEDSIFGTAPGDIQDHQSGQIDGPLSGQVVTIKQLIKRFHPAAMVAEDFNPRESNRSDEYLSPVRLNAMLQLAVHIGYIPDISSIQFQMPGLAKGTATDARLKTWGLYVKGSAHARDATRHAIVFIRRAKSDSHLAIQAWPLQSPAKGRQNTSGILA